MPTSNWGEHPAMNRIGMFKLVDTTDVLVTEYFSLFDRAGLRAQGKLWSSVPWVIFGPNGARCAHGGRHE